MYSARVRLGVCRETRGDVVSVTRSSSSQGDCRLGHGSCDERVRLLSSGARGPVPLPARVPARILCVLWDAPGAESFCNHPSTSRRPSICGCGLRFVSERRQTFVLWRHRRTRGDDSHTDRVSSRLGHFVTPRFLWGCGTSVFRKSRRYNSGCSDLPLPFSITSYRASHGCQTYGTLFCTQGQVMIPESQRPRSWVGFLHQSSRIMLGDCTRSEWMRVIEEAREI